MRDRLAIEHEVSPPPIVPDAEKLKRTLARLFDARHILVHEFPEKLPFELAEVPEMLEAAEEFMNAAAEGFDQLLHGLYPITQIDMNYAAQVEREATEQELWLLVDEIARKTERDRIRELHKLWLAFAEAEAERDAESTIGGSMYPILYHSSFNELASNRLGQLRKWLANEYFGEE